MILKEMNFFGMHSIEIISFMYLPARLVDKRKVILEEENHFEREILFSCTMYRRPGIDNKGKKMNRRSISFMYHVPTAGN